MAKYSNPNLQPNPFVTYRDPQTGLWVVLENANLAQSSTPSDPQEPSVRQSNQKKRANHLL